MKQIGIGLRIVVFSLLIFNSGCAHCNAYDQEKMYTLASALTKLTAAVEEKVLFKEAPAEIKDKELIDLSTKHDPQLKEPFTEYLLKARGVNGHAIVLVCDQSGSKALLEDGGCSSILDQHWWKDQTNHPCEISTQMCLTK